MDQYINCKWNCSTTLRHCQNMKTRRKRFWNITFLLLKAISHDLVLIFCRAIWQRLRTPNQRTSSQQGLFDKNVFFGTQRKYAKQEVTRKTFLKEWCHRSFFILQLLVKFWESQLQMLQAHSFTGYKIHELGATAVLYIKEQNPRTVSFENSIPLTFTWSSFSQVYERVFFRCKGLCWAVWRWCYWQKDCPCQTCEVIVTKLRSNTTWWTSYKVVLTSFK